MKKVNKSVLKEAANKLMFDMSEEQYAVLLSEFDVLTQQMQVLGEIEGLDEVAPMTFPYEIYTTFLREDIPDESISKEDALRNAKDVVEGQIKLPKVVL